MPERASERIWSLRRQWLGNLVPLGVALVCSLAFYRLGVLVQATVGIAVAWYGVSHWGFFENTKIDRELREKVGPDGELIGFVWLSRPTALDVHAELGLMNLVSDELRIVTEDKSYVIRLNEVAEIGRQMNIHSLIGLGGWIALKLENGTTIRLESRMYPTMLKSMTRTKVLFKELSIWKHEKAPA